MICGRRRQAYAEQATIKELVKELRRNRLNATVEGMLDELSD